jgi:hypothetical protein
MRKDKFLPAPVGQIADDFHIALGYLLIRASDADLLELQFGGAFYFL